MGLVCSICNGEATHIVDMNCGRFNHRFYYCDIHTPTDFKLKKLGEKQADTEKPIREEKIEINQGSLSKEKEILKMLEDEHNSREDCINKLKEMK